MEKGRMEKNSIDLGVQGRVACGGGEAIRWRISREEDNDTIGTG